MDRGIRYEALQTESDSESVTSGENMETVQLNTTVDMDDAVPSLPAMVPSMPSYVLPPVSSDILAAAPAPAATWGTAEGEGKDLPQAAPVPPSYEMATTLPSYEEAERTKEEEEEERRRTDAEQGPTLTQAAFPGLGHLANVELGTDGMFLCMFVIAFLFNWIGLLVSVCMTHTIAGRFGAISGFGLSMVKWVAIAKHNNWGSGIADGDSWLWWLLIILGFLIFFRGCTQYLRIKYQWARLDTELRTRLMFMF